MKNPLKLLLTILTLAALCLPAPAQEDEAPPANQPATEAPQADAAQEAPPPKRTAAKKKKKKAKKPEPASEYKFKTAEETPTYKFDKRADPILKPVKKKKKAKTEASEDGSGKPIPKLKRIKSIGEEDKPEVPGMPPGMPKGMPGMGGE